MHYQFRSATHRGCVRANNEDAVLHDEALGLALLADGMGGYNAGEVASDMAVMAFQAEFARWRTAAAAEPSVRAVRTAMEHCTLQAHRAVHRAATDRPECRGMGTTMVACALLAKRLVVAHVGDSRCYRWRDFQLDRLTRDHSVLQDRLDAGLVTQQEAPCVPYRHLITKALGIASAVEPDVRDFSVEPDDLYLLCSDGLSDMLDDEAIADIVAAGRPTDGMAEALVGAANDAGGRDNVSVVLVQGSGSERRGGPFARWLGS